MCYLLNIKKKIIIIIIITHATNKVIINLKLRKYNNFFKPLARNKV